MPVVAPLPQPVQGPLLVEARPVTTLENIIAAIEDTSTQLNYIKYVDSDDDAPTGFSWFSGSYVEDLTVKISDDSTKFITRQGKVVDKYYHRDHGGDCYKITGRLTRELPGTRRCWRFVLGLIATLGTLFLGLFCADIRGLYSRHSQIVYVAVKQNMPNNNNNNDVQQQQNNNNDVQQQQNNNDVQQQQNNNDVQQQQNNNNEDNNNVNYSPVNDGTGFDDLD